MPFYVLTQLRKAIEIKTVLSATRVITYEAMEQRQTCLTELAGFPSYQRIEGIRGTRSETDAIED